MTWPSQKQRAYTDTGHNAWRLQATYVLKGHESERDTWLIASAALQKDTVVRVRVARRRVQQLRPLRAYAVSLPGK
eukprot:6182059-Pleurochrysis_carterae.AAC.2